MDEWLYSGDVTIFKEIRDGVPELLPENEWGHIDVITSAPPGALADDLWTGYSGSSAMAKAILRSVHLLQGRNIFEAAIHEGGEYGEKMPHILVLPAFGCNLVWEDPTNLVAETYADLLTNYAKYFDMVVFAAGRRSNVFCEAFEEKGLTLQTLEDIQETWQEEPEWEEPESEKEGKPYSTELLLHAMFGDVEWLEMNDAWKQDPSKEAWVREMVEKAEQCALKEAQEKQQAEKAEKELEKELKEPVLRQMAEYSGGVSAEPNNKFFDVTGSILTAGWKCEAWKDKAWKNKAWKDNADWYRTGIFTDGKSFVEEGIRLPEDGINGAQEYRMFYIYALSSYEETEGKADDEKETLFMPMLPPQSVSKKRAFAAKMKLGEISEDMGEFENYVRYLATQGAVLSPSNCYRGALQYMTDWREEAVACVMIALDGQPSNDAPEISAELNNKFYDVTDSILTAGWKGKVWKGRKGWYTAGVFTDGKSFVEERICLPENGSRVEQEYEMFYMHTMDAYEKPKGKEKMLSVPMIPPKKVLKKRAFAAKMKLGKISEDMWKFENYVRYLAGWGILLSPSNRYRGALQYMTDWRGKEVVCVMIAMQDNDESYAFSGMGNSYWY